MKTRRRAIKSLLSEKVVNIGDYRSIRNGRSIRRLAFVSSDKAMFEKLCGELKDQAEFQFFETRFSLEQALKNGEWDGVVLDERNLNEDALALCEKLKKNFRQEEMFIFILSEKASKDIVRLGYEKGCDEWITRLDDAAHLARLLAHHLGG